MCPPPPPLSLLLLAPPALRGAAAAAGQATAAMGKAAKGKMTGMRGYLSIVRYFLRRLHNRLPLHPMHFPHHLHLRLDPNLQAVEEHSRVNVEVG